MARSLFESSDIGMGAEFSPCREYRYSLWRIWSDARQAMACIGLNPSTADETENDPTIRRVIGFAKSWGFGSLYMLNAYAYRSTDRKVMLAHPSPVGECNDETIARVTAQCPFILAAWGADCDPVREREVCRAVGKTIHCLQLTKHGRPQHPLYVKADKQPVVFWDPEA